jgi:molybdopterin molybdotransferase
VAPAINRLLGQQLNKLGSATLAQEFPTDQTRIVPVQIENGRAVQSKFRGSAMLRGLAQADALAVISSGNNPLGTTVRLLNLPW